MDTEQILEKDRQTVFHPATNLHDYISRAVSGRVITSAKGVRIQDSEGNEFIDGLAGLYCVNIGYGREEMAEAIYEQAKKLAYYHTYFSHTTEVLAELSERILEIAPSNMSRVYYGLSGSDANETQIKIVRYYNNVRGRNEKKKIISRQRAYHGSSIGSGSLTGLPSYHQHFDLPISGIKHSLAPCYYRRTDPSMSELEYSQYCADKLEALILDEGPQTVAAMIAEPVLGTGGIIPPPEGYWQAVQKVLKKYDILLIADEVVCGFGRLGKQFGSFYYDMKPDLMTLAKGLTSAYQPLSGVLVSDEIWSYLTQGTKDWGVIGHGYTYSGHPIAAASALCNLDIIARENLIDKAAVNGAYLQEKMHLTFAEHPLVGEARGVGLMHALEFAKDKKRRHNFAPDLQVGIKIAQACLEQGLIARPMPHGDILGFAPPLVIEQGDIDVVVEKTLIAVNQVMDQLIRSKDWSPL